MEIHNIRNQLQVAMAAIELNKPALAKQALKRISLEIDRLESKARSIALSHVAAASSSLADITSFEHVCNNTHIICEKALASQQELAFDYEQDSVFSRQLL